MRPKGITLFELLILLFLVGILTTIAIPSFTRLISRYRLTATAESLYYALQTARLEAIKRNNNVYFSFNTGDDWCYGINPGSNCDCSITGNCTLLTAMRSQLEQIDLSALNYGSDFVYFEGSHGAAQNSGSITLTQHDDTSRYITINISRLGNLSMCAAATIGGYPAC